MGYIRQQVNSWFLKLMCWMQEKRPERLTRAKLLWPEDWVRASLKQQGLWGAPGQQWWVPTDSGPGRDKPQTGDRVFGAQGSSMREGNEGYPVWSEPTGLLWHITENFNGGHGRNVSQSTVHRTLLRMGLHSRRPVRVPMMTPVHR